MLLYLKATLFGGLSAVGFLMLVYLWAGLRNWLQVRHAAEPGKLVAYANTFTWIGHSWWVMVGMIVIFAAVFYWRVR